MSRPAPATVLTCAVSFLAGACTGDPPGGGPGDETTVTTVAEWTLSPEPLLSVGVIEGEEPYVLSRVRSGATLPGGGVVVADGGSAELRFYDSAGRHVVSQGQEGDGPGDWRRVDRIRSIGGDSLLVVDPILRRNGVVSTSGAYLGTLPWRSEDLYPSDQFLYGRFWIDAPLAPEDWGLVTRAIDAMPKGDESEMVYARVTAAGVIWVGNGPTGPPGEEEIWRLHDMEGQRFADVRVPEGFVILDMGIDRVLGLVRDEFDIEFVRLHRLKGAPGAGPPATLRDRARASALPFPPNPRLVPPADHRDLALTVREVAIQQEFYFAEHLSYATSIDSLALSRQNPEGLRAELPTAHRGGFLARVTSERGTGCQVGMGSAVLLGTLSGQIQCFVPARDASGG